MIHLIPQSGVAGAFIQAHDDIRASASWISTAARKLMEIKSIRGDAVYLKDGRVLGVVKIKPISFGVLSKEEQDTVIYGFLEFINSLNFPMQISTIWPTVLTATAPPIVAEYLLPMVIGSMNPRRRKSFSSSQRFTPAPNS
jgi:hypothetical protein